MQDNKYYIKQLEEIKSSIEKLKSLEINDNNAILIAKEIGKLDAHLKLNTLDEVIDILNDRKIESYSSFIKNK